MSITQTYTSWSKVDMMVVKPSIPIQAITITYGREMMQMYTMPGTTPRISSCSGTLIFKEDCNISGVFDIILTGENENQEKVNRYIEEVELIDTTFKAFELYNYKAKNHTSWEK